MMKAKTNQMTNLSNDCNAGNQKKENVTRCDCVNDDVEPCTMHTDSCRDLQRYVETPQSCPPSKRGRYFCDVTECSSLYDTAKDLARHKTKCHFMSVEPDRISVSTVDSSSDNACKQSKKTINRCGFPGCNDRNAAKQNEKTVFKCKFSNCNYASDIVRAVDMDVVKCL